MCDHTLAASRSTQNWGQGLKRFTGIPKKDHHSTESVYLAAQTTIGQLPCELRGPLEYMAQTSEQRGRAQLQYQDDIYLPPTRHQWWCPTTQPAAQFRNELCLLEASISLSTAPPLNPSGREDETYCDVVASCRSLTGLTSSLIR